MSMQRWWKSKATAMDFGENVVMFDVDETLLMFDGDPEYNTPRPHQTHIDKLKQHAYRGHTVIVWSAGGAAWAARAVAMLELEAFVDVVMAKPKWFYDDRQAHEILGERVYFPVERKLEEK